VYAVVAVAVVDDVVAAAAAAVAAATVVDAVVSVAAGPAAAVVVVVVDVACYSVAAVWGATLGLGFVMYHLGCSTSVTAGEHSIAIRSYGTPVVIGVSRYCVGVTGCVSFCARALLDTGSARAQNQ